MIRPIRNSRDLKYEKQHLGKKLKKDIPNVAVAGISSFVKKKNQKKAQNSNSQTIHTMVEQGLFFVSAKANERFKFNKITQSIIGFVLTMLIPIFVIKIENLTNNKKKSK